MNNLPVSLNSDPLEIRKTLTSNKEQLPTTEPKFKEVDSQTLPQPSQEIAKTPPLKRKSFAKILVILLAFILLTFGGTLGYYYFAVYDQERFAREVLGFFKEIENEGSVLSNQTVKDNYDYQGAVEILETRKVFFQEQKEKISKIRPPYFGPYKSLISDFSEAFGIFVEASDESKDAAEFMFKLIKLKSSLDPKPSSFSQQTPTIAEIQTIYNEQVPKAKRIGDELFAENWPKSLETSMEELKTSWTKTKTALDTILIYVNSFDPGQPFETSELNQPPTGQVALAIDQVASFVRLLDDKINQADANSILTSPFSEDILKERVGNKAEKIQKQIDEINKKYGESVY